MAHEFTKLESDSVAQALAKTVGARGQNATAIGVLVDRIDQLAANLEALTRRTNPAVPEMELEPEQLAAIKAKREREQSAPKSVAKRGPGRPSKGKS